MTKTGVKLPFEDSKIAVYLRKQIDALSGIKNQREIASEIGYDKPNIISMFKRGEAKVPLDKIPALAKALHSDPAFMFKLALEQYWPKQEAAIAAIFGAIATKNQQAITARIAELSDRDDPELTPELDQALVDFFEKTNDRPSARR